MTPDPCLYSLAEGISLFRLQQGWVVLVRTLRRSTEISSPWSLVPGPRKHPVGITGEQMVLLKRQTHPPPKLPHRRVLLRGQCLENHREDQLRAFDRIYARNLRVGHKNLAELLARADLHGNPLQ